MSAESRAPPSKRLYRTTHRAAHNARGAANRSSHCDALPTMPKHPLQNQPRQRHEGYKHVTKSSPGACCPAGATFTALLVLPSGAQSARLKAVRGSSRLLEPKTVFTYRKLAPNVSSGGLPPPITLDFLYGLGRLRVAFVGGIEHLRAHHSNELIHRFGLVGAQTGLPTQVL